MTQSQQTTGAGVPPDGQQHGGNPDFDPDALKAKYRAERDKRMREGRPHEHGSARETALYMQDPYAHPEYTRAPLSDEVEVIVVGGGFGGMLAGIRLREAGITDIRIIDKAGDFGGTWYWNRYPGVACDIESYCYIPLLEETGYMPVEKYSRGREILRYCRTLAEKYDLYRHACFQTEVTQIQWDESSARWIVATNRGDRMKARFVMLATGVLERLNLPGIPGIETFEGHSFHTCRWDYAYTGGSAEEGLPNLADKRVGVIGTGASGVQCIPHLGRWAKQLYVFQRTPSSIDVRGNRPTDPEWARSLEPGWQKKRITNFTLFLTAEHPKEDLVNDGWTDNFRRFAHPPMATADTSQEEMARLRQLEDFRKMEEIRHRVDSIVTDKATAEALKPYYNLFCKRPCFHDEYLATFNRPNVTLVDTKGKGVERITEKGVVVGGEEFAVDCLIYATGFDFRAAYKKGGSGFAIHGRDGAELSEKWSHGVSTLHGMHTKGFPNLFVINVAQTGYTPSFPYLLDEESRHAAYIIKQCQERGLRSVEVTEEAENAWVDLIVSRTVGRDKFLAECTPSNTNNDGRPEEDATLHNLGALGAIEYAKILEDWRNTGEMKGLVAVTAE